MATAAAVTMKTIRKTDEDCWIQLSVRETTNLFMETASLISGRLFSIAKKFHRYKPLND